MIEVIDSATSFSHVEHRNPLKPPVVYVGNKQRLAGWITGFFPTHETYCEPFGGSGSVLLAKQPSRQEVYNDVDGSIVNFFRVLRDAGKRKRLVELLDLTPYCRDEHTFCKNNYDAPQWTKWNVPAAGTWP